MIGTSHHIPVNAQSETIYILDVVCSLNYGTSNTLDILIFPNSKVLKQSTRKRVLLLQDKHTLAPVTKPVAKVVYHCTQADQLYLPRLQVLYASSGISALHAKNTQSDLPYGTCNVLYPNIPTVLKSAC